MRQTRVLNCMPSVDTDADWRVEGGVEAGVFAPLSPPPRAMDHRAAWWKVADQGSVGICVGFALADGALRWHLVKAGRLKQTERLSERFPALAAKHRNRRGLPTTFVESVGASIKEP